MHTIGSVCLGLVIGWLSVLIVLPVRQGSRGAIRAAMAYLVTAVFGIAFLAFVGVPMIEPFGLVAGVVVGAAGCIVMRYLAKKRSAH